MLAALVVVGIALSGCAVSIPSDPEGTLDEVRGGTLQVGASPNGDAVQVDGGAVSGAEVELVERFAAHVDAEIEWTVGSEQALVRALERGELQLVVGGITDATPWVDRAGMTRPYAEVRDASGETHKLVMLVPMGENAFLSELETFLSEEVAAR